MMQRHLAEVSALRVWKGAKCHYSAVEAFIFVVVWCTTSLASFHMQRTLSQHIAEEMYGYMSRQEGRKKDSWLEGKNTLLSTHNLWKRAAEGVKTLIHYSDNFKTISRLIFLIFWSQTHEINKWGGKKKKGNTIDNLKRELLWRVNKYYCLREMSFSGV